MYIVIDILHHVIVTYSFYQMLPLLNSMICVTVVEKKLFFLTTNLCTFQIYLNHFHIFSKTIVFK